MLVNMSDSEVQLLDIETADVVRQFLGQKQGNFIIRSTFGGAAENFVVSGSEGKECNDYSVVNNSKFGFLTVSRFENLYMAQGEQHTCRNPGGAYLWLRECCCVESEGSGYVCIRRR